jgi:hypothetical protein
MSCQIHIEGRTLEAGKRVCNRSTMDQPDFLGPEPHGLGPWNFLLEKIRMAMHIPRHFVHRPLHFVQIKLQSNSLYRVYTEAPIFQILITD